MELHIEKVREEFIDHIVALQDPKDIVIPRDFISRFIDIIIPSKKWLASIPDPRFPIEVSRAANILEVPVENLRRIILRSPRDVSRTPVRSQEFRKGIDYILEQRVRIDEGGVIHPLFMTVSCFQRACMQMRGEKGKRARYYFDLIARSYYDYMGEDIWERLKAVMT